MSIGYACMTVGVPHTDMKSCMLKNVSEGKLMELISYNLNSLESIIDYNIKNNIMLFRISSDLIPFGSSTVNPLPWWEMFSSQLQQIGQKIQISGMRVSMHPGQYTVLNSPNAEVVAKAMKDLKYHVRVLDSLETDIQHKIVLHIGGVYENKQLAIRRFISHYAQLDESVKQRLILENDDRSYNIGEVLEIGTMLHAPVVFDNLHNAINPCNKQMSDAYWIDQCRKTWNQKDGNQKIHYSQQAPLKKPGSHSNFIRINEFMSFYDSIGRKDLDIMLEVKDKNLSAVKCMNCTSHNKDIKVLELEWSKYKYSALESSPSDYLEMRKLLRSKRDCTAIDFYNILEAALQKPREIGNSVNAAQHIWGYFKNIASPKEKDAFIKNIKDYQQSKTTINSIKTRLLKMAVKYQQSYLLNSYYFIHLNKE